MCFIKMTYTALSIDGVTGYDMIWWAFLCGVTVDIYVFESDPKLGKGFGEIDHPPWLTGTQTCFHTGCSCARACARACSRACACARRKTFPNCFPTAAVAPKRQSLWYTKAPHAVATFATRGSL